MPIEITIAIINSARKPRQGGNPTGATYRAEARKPEQTLSYGFGSQTQRELDMTIDILDAEGRLVQQFDVNIRGPEDQDKEKAKSVADNLADSLESMGFERCEECGEWFERSFVSTNPNDVIVCGTCDRDLAEMGAYRI